MMEYKGYTAHFTIDFEENLIHGRVEGIDDIIGFEGKTPEEAAQAFRDSVDFYLEACERFSQEPQKPRRAAA